MNEHPRIPSKTVSRERHEHIAGFDCAGVDPIPVLCSDAPSLPKSYLRSAPTSYGADINRSIILRPPSSDSCDVEIDWARPVGKLPGLNVSVVHPRSSDSNASSRMNTVSRSPSKNKGIGLASALLVGTFEAIVEVESSATTLRFNFIVLGGN